MEPRFEYQIPGWDNKVSDKYKIRYFLSHCIRLVEEIERQEQQIKDTNSEHWVRSHNLVSRPQEITMPNLDKKTELN
jgi:hypothetical protein